MKPELYTEVILVATPHEIAQATATARESGRLIWRSAPKPVAAGDPRMRVAFRLTSHR
jgi:hypothetical protein